MSLNSRMDKLWYIYTMEYKSGIKRNYLLNHKKTRKNQKCILLSERKQPGKAIYYIIPIIQHTGNKTIEIVREISGC